MKKLLLCPPTTYDIEYEINPWMHVYNKVNKKKVAAEYESIKSLYEELGAEIYEVAQDPTLPDMVYTANIGFVYNNIFIPSNFKYEQRRKESEYGIEFFEKQFGFVTQKIPDDIFFEGQGDLLQLDNRFFYGYGKRSDKKAIPHLEKILETKLVSFELINPYYYHLDTCFAPLTDDTVVINPKSFTEGGLKTVHEQFSNVITASAHDNSLIACNLVTLGKNIIIASGISDDLKEAFDKTGFTTHEKDTTEYRKGGGSVKCITFEF